MTVRYVLRRPAPAGARPPELDDDQQAVVDHDGGPVLVLAGPGTGKTTTLVESVVDRVQRRGLSPDQVLVLTFSRRAADELRARITARLGQTTAGAVAMTFHAFCYALVRRASLRDPDADTADGMGTDVRDGTSGGQLLLPFAGAAIRSGPEPLAWQPTTLVSASEQDVRLRDLLLGSAPAVSSHGDVSTSVAWPRALFPALRTRGLAAELQAVLARTRALGLDPDQLAAIGRRDEQPGWVAAAELFASYLEVFDAQGLLDYGELVHRARLLAADPETQASLRSQFRYVVVDEYQDTDPAQVGLLRALAGDGRDLLVVGDPDQSIYAFRGADVGGILRFPRDFPRSDGRPAEVRALQGTRRYGPVILAAARAVGHRLPVPAPGDAEEFARFRAPRSVDPPYGAGRVEVRLFTSPAAEAEQVAELLRRAHLEDGVAWHDMAVLVRSGRQSIPRFRRTLTAAGVPLEVAGDEVPLRSEPAVQVLLQALRVIERLHRAGEPAAAGATDAFGADPPPLIRPDEAEALLVSPLGGLDPGGVRRLARRLRMADREEHVGVRLARPSARLLADALAEPGLLTSIDGPEAERARRLAALLASGAARLRGGATAESLLWHVWDGTGWPHRLRAAADSAAGGGATRAAHRDLDAVVAVFAQVAREEERRRGRGLVDVLAEIDQQQIPAGTQDERGVRGQGVRLLTAHRAKGLQWRLVVVAGVQDGAWPDLRRRGTLLQAERIDVEPGREPPPRSALLADERRLFYVAITRARERLVATAVASPSEGGDQPSPFLAELGVDPADGVEGRPSRPLSLTGLLGELRAMAEVTDDEDVRRAAAARIARLVGIVPAADPRRWWGVHPPTRSTVPVRPADEPLALSGSALDGLVTCPLRWFLAREARGATATSVAQGFGSLVHGLAEAVATGEVAADVETMVAHLDRVWDQLEFAVPWASVAERREAEEAIARFVSWHGTDRGRELLAAEHAFAVELTVGGEPVVLRGSMDRVERDHDGRIVVVDFKTGRSAPRGKDVEAHPQLGAYQVAVRAGAADELAGVAAVPGGAELVHLRQEVHGEVRVQHQRPPDEAATWVADDQLAHAVATVRGETFVAAPNRHCDRCEFRTSCPAQPEGAAIVSARTPDVSAEGPT